MTIKIIICKTEFENENNENLDIYKERRKDIIRILSTGVYDYLKSEGYLKKKRNLVNCIIDKNEEILKNIEVFNNDEC